MSNTKKCSNVPVELILATTDPELYDAKTNKWLWNGQMYWAVECLPHRQRSVSDRILPKVNPNNYLPLIDSPAVWDYCRSENCGANSDTMQIIFTFNPHSTDPNDFLQYVIDIHCHVTDSPRHDIKDSGGNKFYLDIVEVAKMTKEPYVEVWIAKTHEDKKLTIAALQQAHIDSLTKRELGESPSSKSSSNALLIIIVVLVIVLLIALVVGGIVFFKHKGGKPQPPSEIPKSVGAGNIY